MRRRLALAVGILALSAIGLLPLAGCGAATTAHSASLPAAISCDPALRLFGPSPPPPRPAATPLGASILARYALFRRAPQPGDALLPGARTSAGLARELARDFTLARWYPAEVRALGAPSHGLRYHVLPAFGRPEAVPASCRPASARRELAAQQLRRLTELVACVIAVGPGGSAPNDCEPFAAIEADVDLFASGGQADPVVSLVPDGVAALRIAYRSGQPVTVPVVGNAMVFRPPPPSPRLNALQSQAARLSEQAGGCYGKPNGPFVCGNPRLTKAQNRRVEQRLERAQAAYQQAELAADPTRIEWLDAAGHVVRTLLPPTRAFLRSVDVGQLRAPISG